MIDHNDIKQNMLVRLVRYKENPGFFDYDETMFELCRGRPIVIIDEIQGQTSSGHDELLYVIEPLDRVLYPDTYQDFVWRAQDLEKVNTYLPKRKKKNGI